MQSYEKKVRSQNGEDGVIEYIFSQIGTTNQIAVEFGAGDGQESNTAWLAEQGWKCFWFDAQLIESVPVSVVYKQVWLTVNNIVDEFESQQIPRHFDLLSIDLDGNDYHLRAALRDYHPRVIVQEYNGCYSADAEYIMPRNDSYSWQLWNRNFGASLLSLTQQADTLGYDLVHCEQQGVNAFFVRRDVNVFPVQSVADAWRPLWWADKI